MKAFVVRRLLTFVPTLWVIATATFFLLRFAPGGPFESEKAIPPAARTALLRLYGLDRPLIEQYGRYLAGVVRGDFGPSYQYPQRSVRELIGSGLGVSAELGGLALLLALLVGLPAGIIAAKHAHRAPDRIAMAFALAGVAIPNFVLGPLLVLVFALSLYWLPPALWLGAPHRVLPVLTLAAATAAYVARLARAGMLEVLHADWVRTARAKGVSEPRIVLGHALRLGLLPVVSYLGPATAGIVMGSVAVEQVFAIPGLGRVLVHAAFDRDYTVVLGIVLFYAVALLTLNLAVDVAYALLDPRVELQ